MQLDNFYVFKILRCGDGGLLEQHHADREIGYNQTADASLDRKSGSAGMPRSTLFPYTTLFRSLDNFYVFKILRCGDGGLLEQHHADREIGYNQTADAS